MDIPRSVRGMPKPIGKVHVDPQPEETASRTMKRPGSLLMTIVQSIYKFWFF